MPKKQLSIQKILGILLHRLPMIILSGVLMALIFFVYTSLAIQPVYSASSMIYIQNYGKQQDTDDKEATSATDPTSSSSASDSSKQSNNEVAQKIFNSDISGSSALASTCVTLFQNSNDITQYYDGCDVSMEVTNNSFYITITANGTDPKKCANVANIVAEKCDGVFRKYFSYGRTGIIREAYDPVTPISPNKTRNTIIGALVGLVLACGLAVLLELIDTTLKSDDDLSAMYKIPVFAEIPDFENSGR